MADSILDGVTVKEIVDPTKIAIAFFTALGAMFMAWRGMRRFGKTVNKVMGCVVRESWPLRTHQTQDPPVKFAFAQEEKGGRLGIALDSIVAHGSIISGGRVQNSVLSHNVRVNSYTEVHDSILMENVDIGRHCRIRRAIIDKDVIIPPGTEIGYNRDEDRQRFHVTPSGIVVIGKGACVEEREGAITSQDLP